MLCDHLRSAGKTISSVEHTRRQGTPQSYSLLGTCKLWNINPEEWLTDIFNRIGDCKQSKLEELLHHKWTKQQALPTNS